MRDTAEKAVRNGRLLEDYKNTATRMIPGVVFCMAEVQTHKTKILFTTFQISF